MMIRSLIVALSLLSVAAASAPTHAGLDAPPGDFPLLVSAEWVAAHLDDPDVVILHVAREPGDYEEGHIPGARFVPMQAIVENRDGLLNVLPPVDQLEAAFRDAGVSGDSRVVIYGDMDGLAATRAFFTLDVLGHRQVAVLDGGLAAYRDAGHPLSRESAETPRGTFTPRLDASIPVEASWIADRLDRDALLLVDARPKAQYTGEDPGTDVERPGHIPGAVNLFWQESLREDGSFRPRDELMNMWMEAGLTDDAEVVTYCRTGVQASHAYFTARYLGLSPKIYDPSFIHWSNMTEYPVSRAEEE